MAKRIQQRVIINGEIRWLSGSTQQELFDAYLAQAVKAGIVISPKEQDTRASGAPLFGSYLTHFVNTYKSRQQTLTVQSRQRIIRKHILPRLGYLPIDEIRTADIQVWFDELCDQNYARETILKIRHIISPAFDSAVEDELMAVLLLQLFGVHAGLYFEGIERINADVDQITYAGHDVAAGV